jgi:hypothetical protein
VALKSIIMAFVHIKAIFVCYPQKESSNLKGPFQIISPSKMTTKSQHNKLSGLLMYTKPAKNCITGNLVCCAF